MTSATLNSLKNLELIFATSLSRQHQPDPVSPEKVWPRTLVFWMGYRLQRQSERSSIGWRSKAVENDRSLINCGTGYSRANVIGVNRSRLSGATANMKGFRSRISRLSRRHLTITVRPARSSLHSPRQRRGSHFPTVQPGNSIQCRNGLDHAGTFSASCRHTNQPVSWTKLLSATGWQAITPEITPREGLISTSAEPNMLCSTFCMPVSGINSCTI